jgi:O-antigen biosynthesis protein
MVQISVVVVNYNVKHLLKLSLYSVQRASQNIKVEIIVVDNTSVDGSCDMVKTLFPDVILVENSDNVGFGKANNQAIAMAKGEYVLILNPDTVIGESTLDECFNFMRNTLNAGAIGVHMTDGWGNYLRESKRALPTPLVSFFKVFGLSSVFPQSTVFAKYHLGYLDKDCIHKVEVLSGAFMFMPTSLLKKIGMFDEAFFMYGEDIDLSYRVLLAGYQNYYLGTTRIIHFKGESTKKGSLNYVLVFYKAMEIFARKHFTGNGFTPYRIMIESAIWLRAMISIIKRFCQIVAHPFVYVIHQIKHLFPKENKVEKTLVVADDDEYERYKTLVDPHMLVTQKHPEAFIQSMMDKQFLKHLSVYKSVVLCGESMSCSQMVFITEHMINVKSNIKYLVPNAAIAVGSSH